MRKIHILAFTCIAGVVPFTVRADFETRTYTNSTNATLKYSLFVPANYDRNGLGLASITDLEGNPAPTPEFRVSVPSDMVAIGDATDVYWNIAPYQSWLDSLQKIAPELVPNHNKGFNALFCDGHLEYGKLVSWFKPDDLHRRRWNQDNQPHPETWVENRSP